jgi:hypothetical protein
MVNKSTSSTTFSTNDASLAAWLYINNIEWLDTLKDSFPAKFVFKNDNGECDALVKAFKGGIATGNIVAYDRMRNILIAKARGKP